MNASLIILLAIGLIGLVVFFIEWGGRCKKCRSWNNWNKVSISRDDHQPSMRFINYSSKCAKCGHEIHRGTEAKNVTDM